MNATTTTKPANPDPALATVESMIAELTQLRDSERDRDRRSAYQAAIDRLVGLAYRLRQPRPVVIARPRRPMQEPEPAAPPAPPQRTLPLGPVVIARKPKRR